MRIAGAAVQEGGRTSAASVPLVLTMLAASACGALTPFAIPRPSDADGDADADADGDADADADGDGDVQGGPLLFVGAITVVPERVCDVSGDGTLDNSVADLGGDLAPVFAFAMDAAFERSRDAASRAAVHFRWIDDLSTPRAERVEWTAYGARDTDTPPAPLDDMSGEEPFYATARYLDPCGEPAFVNVDTRIDDGVVSGGPGVFGAFTGNDLVALAIAEVSGQLEPGGEHLVLRACGHATFRELGRIRGVDLDAGELSLLEVFLAGGAPFGITTVPGLRADVDLDGDGLETFVVDGSGHIASCIDGDRTPIAGSDCWQDDRMADAFSLTLRFEGVPARSAGREPAWEYKVPRGCDAYPPEDSFFSTVPPTDTLCAELDELCDPLAQSPCCDATHRCSGGDRDRYRCAAPCVAYACDYGDHLGTCYAPDYVGEPYCVPLGNNVRRTGCTDEASLCSTEYDVSENTHCFASSGICVELCTPGAAPCGDSHRCIPNAFESGGVCVYVPGEAPE